MFQCSYELRPRKNTPRIKEELFKLQESECYCEVKSKTFYSQVPPHSDWQEQLSMLTADDIFSTTRVTHGSTNETGDVQAQLSKSSIHGT